MSDKQLKQREQKMAEAMQLVDVQEQVSALLAGDTRKMQQFQTKMLQMSMQKGLENCSAISVIQCGITSLVLDLPMLQGQGYIVNYDGVANFDPGYKGWQVLADRAGWSVIADIVYSCDEFRRTGLGHDAKYHYVASPDQKVADDTWVKENYIGVMVSYLEKNQKDESVLRWVPRDMIEKIIGKSPSTQTERGRKYGPHGNWAEQMIKAKGLKQILTKMPIDLSKASQLAEAIQIVNETEKKAQSQPEPFVKSAYQRDQFDENYPAWVNLVKGGKDPNRIITQMKNAFTFDSEMLALLEKLHDYKPTDEEIIENPEEKPANDPPPEKAPEKAAQTAESSSAPAPASEKKTESKGAVEVQRNDDGSLAEPDGNPY